MFASVFRRISFAAALAAFAPIAAAEAHEFKLGPITIDHPWTRATAVQTGAAYMSLKLAGREADRLVKATSPDAAMVEMHTMAIENGVMRMHEVKAIDLKPGATTELKPGGFHIMMIGLKRPLREGESIKLTLTFEKAGTVDVDATVEKAGSPAPKKHAH